MEGYGDLVGILGRDVVVHLEEVAVALFDDLAAETTDGLGEVEIDAPPARPHSPALVAYFLRRARGDVARGEVPEARVLPLQVVIALRLGDLAGVTRVALLLRHPDPAVVAQRLLHQP